MGLRNLGKACYICANEFQGHRGKPPGIEQCICLNMKTSKTFLQHNRSSPEC